MKFERHPTTVEGQQWTGENAAALMRWCVEIGAPRASWEFDGLALNIETLGGVATALPRDWVVFDPKSGRFSVYDTAAFFCEFRLAGCDASGRQAFRERHGG